MSFLSGKSRTTKIVFWLALVGIVVTTLIVLEQIAILYVLATVSLVALLLTVAFADLEDVDRGDASVGS